MFSTKFLNFFKRRSRPFLWSLLIVLGYFIGSSLISPKITSVAESLLRDVIKENISSKKSSIAFEFNRLNSYLLYSESLIEDYIQESNPALKEESFHKLEQKLLFVFDLAASSDLISNPFLYLVRNQEIEEVYLADLGKGIEASDIHAVVAQVASEGDRAFVDRILNTSETVINRKLYARQIDLETTIIVGYDISLLGFWEYFSETSRGGSGYSVLTDETGICILHPEVEYIGRELEGFFETVSINRILDEAVAHPQTSLKVSNPILRDTAISSFLGLEVLRYFDTVKVGDKSLILIESFPLDINLKEATSKIQSYFSWISLLAFLVFVLLLLVSRYQLKEEYAEKLKIVEEKEKLEIANEKYQKENAVLQLSQLKKKMNPHFLFNSLNSLHALIDSKPDVSQDFVSRLASVYRYVLEGKEGNLVSLKEELGFMEQYVFLQEIRFRESLNVVVTNNADFKIDNKKIPFLSLQSLVENAIKHNVITKAKPLHIEVELYEDRIVVSNNYTPRKNKFPESHFLGLTYLKNIYEHHAVYSFEAKLVGDEFRCVLPLLS